MNGKIILKITKIKKKITVIPKYFLLQSQIWSLAPFSDYFQLNNSSNNKS